jgi:hypothetical protein
MISTPLPHIRCAHSSKPTVHARHWTIPSCGCSFAHHHAAAIMDLGWVVVGIAGALVWLVLLIATGFNPVAVSLGLLILLLLPSHP